MGELKGYKGRDIEVVQWMKGSQDKLYILYPGRNYGPNHPLFYYLLNLLKIGGANYVFFNFNWGAQASLKALDQDSAKDAISQEVLSSFEYLNGYKKSTLTFMAKSLGTLALSLIDQAPEDIKRRIEARHWLTPFPDFLPLKSDNPSNPFKDYYYIGSADPFYKADDYKLLSEHAHCSIFNDLGHSFEKGMDILDSIDGLKQCLKALEMNIFSK